MDVEHQAPRARSSPQHSRKRTPRSDAKQKRSIDGAGVWATCVKGKERAAVGELYDLFESIADELWPEGEGSGEDHAEGVEEEEEDLEKQVARELALLKRPRKAQRFMNCHTNTACVVFIECKPPIDPVRLVTTHIERVRCTGITQTRYTHRLFPVSGTCAATLPDIQALCYHIVRPFFDAHPGKKYTYKIELHTRSHNAHTRAELTNAAAACVPPEHTVRLDDADVFVLVEVFKGVCGVSVVRDYYKLLKFNVMELAGKKVGEEFDGEGSGRIRIGGVEGGGVDE